MTTEELIMLHYDGELDPQRTREVEQVLARDPRARELLESFQQVGALLREADAARPPGPDLTTPILEHVFGSRKPRPRELPVSLAARSKRRSLAWGGAALALAAGLALLLGQGKAPESAAPTARAPVMEAAAPVAALSPLEGDVSEPSVAVESVDFGAQQGAIFLVPSSDTGMLVVWTLDEPANTGREIGL